MWTDDQKIISENKKWLKRIFEKKTNITEGCLNHWGMY